MVPRSKSKRLTKQLTKAGVKSSVANTTTEESFVNNFQMASTSSPSNGGLHEIRYFSSVSNIVARGEQIIQQRIEQRRLTMIEKHKNMIKAVKMKIDTFKLLIAPEVGNSFVRDITFWQGQTQHFSSISEEASTLGNMSMYKCRERPARATQQTVDVKNRLRERTTSKSKSHERNTPASQFKTPRMKNIPQLTPATITPKVDLSKPMSIKRRPKQGEMAVSLTGSPLLVSSVTHDEFASVNVPLPDGKVLAILPQTLGFEPDDIPHLDNQTRQQLNTLKSHLQIFCDHVNKG